MSNQTEPYQGNELLLKVDGFVIFSTAVIMSVTLFAFAMFVGVDAKKALERRAHWVPGSALVLSALTIQALSFVALTDVSIFDIPDEKYFVFLLHFQLILDCGRLSICIFIGYVLPRMVSSQSVKDLGLITALAMSLFVQIMNEFNYMYLAKDVKGIKEYIQESPGRKQYVYWYELSIYMFFVSMIFLVFVTTCAVIAGKTVRRLLKQRIALIFSTADEIHISEAQDSWKNIEDIIFKSWLVTRVAQPDYVIARSVLNSAAAFVITLCTLFSILKTSWIMVLHGKDFKNYFHNMFAEGYYNPISLGFVVCTDCIFVTVGWAVICWRWITTLFFFPKFTRKGARFFCVEDYWINSIIELKHVCDVKSLPLQTHSVSNFGFTSLLIKRVLSMRLHHLLYAVKALQILVVLICKSFHLLSEMLFMLLHYIINLFSDMVCMLVQFIIKRLLIRIGAPLNHGQQEASPNSGYSSRFEEFENILEYMCMPGEKPRFLWKANSSSINQIELLMRQGREKGSNSDLVKCGFVEFCPEWIDQGFELLAKLKTKSLPEVDKYFPDLKNPCWKLIVVSLLDVLMQLHGKNSAPMMNSIKYCEEVWDMLSFADNATIEAGRLKLNDHYDADAHQISMAADQEFYRIQKAYRKFDVSSNSHGDAQGLDGGKRFVEHQLTKAVDLLKVHHIWQNSGEENACAENSKLHDAMDWMKIAPHYSLYKLLKVMEAANSEDLIVWAEFSLKIIIAACLSKLPHILFMYAKQCAQELDEDGLWNAVYMTGKSGGILEAFGLQPILKTKQMEKTEWLVELTREGNSSNYNVV